MDTSFDLPAPLCPTRTVLPPCVKATETLSATVTARYRLVILLSSIIALIP